MSSTQNCAICGQPLNENEHGNRKFHETCEKKMRWLKNRLAYQKIKDIRNTAISLEKVLEVFHLQSEDKIPLDKKLLDAEDFKWDFNSRISKTKDGKPIFWIINHGYSFADNKQNQIIIYYDNQ